MKKYPWNRIASFVLAASAATGCNMPTLPGLSGKLDDALGRSSTPKLGFHQTPQLVHTLEISRSAPEAWSARFSRGVPLVSGEDPSWQIDSLLNPQGHPFKDRVAFQSRLDHLLVTLSTLTILGPAPRGTLASLGLSPPIASLRWQTEDGRWELSLGEVQSDGTQVCLSPEWKEPQICRGAALEMVAQVEKLEQLRLPTLATFRSEDVEAIEVERQGQPQLIARREGAGWVAHGRKIALDDSLEKLTHSRIREFLEEEEQTAQTATGKDLAANLKDSTELIFKHASGESTRLKIGSRHGQWIGTNSARPDGTFELHPETAKLIQKLARQ